MPIQTDSSKKRTLFLWVFVLGALIALYLTREVLLPFVLALVIAYVLTPAVSLAERAKMPRWVAVLLVYTITLGTTYGFLAMVTPRLAREIAGLRQELPALSVRVRDNWVPAIQRKAREVGLSRPEEVAETPPGTPEAPPPALKVVPNKDGSFNVELSAEVEIRETDHHAWRVSPLTDAVPQSFDISRAVSRSVDTGVLWAQRNSLQVLRFGSSIVAGLSQAIFKFFLTLMLAAYVILTREKILDFFRVLVKPMNRPSFDLLLARLDRGLAGVVRGQLLICLVNGVLSAIGFSIIGLKYWPILALVAGIMSIIPIFGSILSTIPAVAIGLTQSFGVGLFVFVWIVGIHQIEANILNPKIYGIAAKIHPVLVIFSLLVGEHFFGLWGALLAVPLMSIVQNTFIHFRAIALGADAPTDTFLPVPPRE